MPFREKGFEIFESAGAEVLRKGRRCFGEDGFESRRTRCPEPFFFLLWFSIFKKRVRLEIFWHIVLQALSHCTLALIYICIPTGIYSYICRHTPIFMHLSTTAAFYFAAATNFCHWPPFTWSSPSPSGYSFYFVYFSPHFFVVFAYQMMGASYLVWHASSF